MVEHQLPKLAFAGSIPVSRSRKKALDSRVLFCFGSGNGNRIGSHEHSECFAWQRERAMMPFQRVGPHRRGFPSDLTKTTL